MGFLVHVLGKYLAQQQRPQGYCSAILLLSQALPFFSCAAPLRALGMRYESYLLYAASIISTLCHASQELLFGAQFYATNVRGILLIDNLMNYSLLAAATVQLSGLSKAKQTQARALLFVLDLGLLLHGLNKFMNHTVLMAMPIALVLFCWRSGSYKGVSAELLVSCTGLVPPATIMYILAESAGLSQGSGRIPINQPAAPYYWVFHGLWHCLYCYSVYAAMCARHGTTLKSASVARQQSNQNYSKRTRRPTNRWWLTVLLSRFLPSSEKRAAVQSLRARAADKAKVKATLDKQIEGEGADDTPQGLNRIAEEQSKDD
ncbi:hypothetical protein CYMTET_51895 [Cymbomonas tetramitiformis]|uniref:Uncharacterized protein n=1 Tax=Cymbomonas tetramitiformis TaxID=36881 RepID=A0AAE0ERC4_9CHLO|nr:hypothetical protein CYMTET_51895 [Cymbomonas tetramitiformis]